MKKIISSKNNPQYQEIKSNGLRWLNFSRNSRAEVDFISANFNFHDLDLRAVLPPIQRPRLFDHEEYIFMILQFPIYNKKERSVIASELDFFISQNTLITVNNGNLSFIKDFFDQCQNDSSLKKRNFKDMGSLIAGLLDYLILACMPMLNHVNLDVDRIERQIFSSQEQKMVHEISIIKRNIINFRKTIQLHKSIIRKLMEKSPRFYKIDHLSLQYYNLISHTKENWDSLDGYKDSIDALHQTNESLISYKSNQIIKTLTIFSVIVFPLTLLAAVFGMNVVNMPLVGDHLGFWEILALMFLLSLGMLSYFKYRKWL